MMGRQTAGRGATPACLGPVCTSGRPRSPASYNEPAGLQLPWGHTQGSPGPPTPWPHPVQALRAPVSSSLAVPLCPGSTVLPGSSGSCMEGQAGLERAMGHRHTHACMPLPMCLRLSVGMGLHKWPCPHTRTHTYPRVHAFTHVRLPACAFADLHVHTCACIHVCTSHIHGCVHPRVCSPACAVTRHWCLCSPAWGCAPPCACVLTHTACTYLCVHVCSHVCVCIHLCACSAVCAHMYVHAFNCVCACIHLCVCMCSPACTDVRVPVFPHAAACSHSACFQPCTYMLHVHACIYPGVCSHAFTHTHPCAQVLTHTCIGSHASILPCFWANVRVHTRQDMCMHPPMRARAHPHVHVLTHTCAHAPTRVCVRTRRSRVRVLTRVCWCHPAACAALAPRLPQPCPGSWGCQEWAGGLRCPGTGRGGQALLRGAQLARRGPGEGIWPARGWWPCPPTPPCRAGVNQGIPEPAQQQCCTTPLGTATPTGRPPPQCHPKSSGSDAVAVSARDNTTTVTQALCPLHVPLGRGPGTAPCPDPA